MPAIVPAFQSREHIEWLARRLEKNVRFRQHCEEWSRVSLDDKRCVAAAIAGPLVERAA